MDKLQFQDSVVATAHISHVAAEKMIAGLYGKRQTDSILSIAQEIIALEDSLLTERILEHQNVSKTSMAANIAGGIVSLLVIILILVFLNRDMILRKKAEEHLILNEQKYREIVENSRAVMYTADMKGDFVYVSPQAVALTGYTLEELTNMSFVDLVETSHIPEVTSFYINQASKSLPECLLEFPVIQKNGNRIWVEQTSVLLYTNKMISGFQCVVKDITERKRVEAELLEMEAQKNEYQFKINAILDNTPMMMYVKDLEGRYTLANKKFLDSFSISETEVIGKTIFDIAEPKLAEPYAEGDRKVIETGMPYEMEQTVDRPEGKAHILTLKFPLFDKDHQLFAVCGIGRDITEMVRNRQELILARKKAEQAEQLQEQFLANMSHEIRTPMNGIIGMTNLLSETSLNEQQLEFVNLIRNSGNTLLVLINDILDLSKIKAGKLTIESIPFDLYSLLNRLHQSVRIRAAEKNLDLILSIHPNVPKNITGDPHRLEQILLNLLSNAVKFTEMGYIRIDVSVESREGQKASLRFSVTDTGIGIQENMIHHVFESFAQAGSDISRKFGGSGLGLSISKKLVDLQKGEFDVKSRYGSGSTFSVKIPYQISDSGKDLQVNSSSNKVSSNIFPSKRVLIVEDNEINQQVIYHHLKRMSIDVSIANNGKIAVELLEKGNQYDLIIMDLQMPEMNGFQAAAYIRTKLEVNTPIVAMTASVLRNEKKKCFEVGMNDYLTKPFSPEDLSELMDRYLGDKPMVTLEMTSASSNKAYNLSMLREVGEENFITRIIELFLTNTPAIIKDLREETIQENWHDVLTQANKLKSSVGVMQIDSMLQNLRRIEELASKKEESDQLLTLIEELDNDFSLLQPMLKAEMHSAKKSQWN